MPSIKEIFLLHLHLISGFQPRAYDTSWRAIYTITRHKWAVCPDVTTYAKIRAKAPGRSNQTLLL